MRIFFSLLACFFLLSTNPLFAEMTLEKTGYGYEIKVDGKLFTAYRTDAYNGMPLLWPIVGPSGHRMTREYPLNQDAPLCEAKDHPHHRSLWFDHGEVSDAEGKIEDFWALGKGTIKHKGFIKASCDGKSALLVTANDWVARDGKILCSDERTLRFASQPDRRTIDFTVKITAADSKILFGDTKEGTFGIRVPGSMDVDAKKRAKKLIASGTPAADVDWWGGTILNSLGDKDEAAWAKRADWVDYSGPVEDAAHGRKTVGITVMNHPSSFRYPTYWHVRAYGLFAANPFGVHDFEKKTEKAGALEMKAGEAITLRYLVLLHEGGCDTEKNQNEFKRFAETGTE